MLKSMPTWKIMLPPIGKVLNNTRVVTPNTRQCFLRAAAECWIIPIAGVWNGMAGWADLILQGNRSLQTARRPFSKCCRPQNSPLLSGVVAFPDFSKIEGQRLCLSLAHHSSCFCCCRFRGSLAVSLSQTQTLALNIGKVCKSDYPWK